MPPKRKAVTKAKKGPPAKKAKNEFDEVKAVLKKGPSFRKKVHNIDKIAQLRYFNGCVVDEFDCMLNQTNINRNNNKYYVIQLIESQGKFYVWTRWGRVGEDGSNLSLGPYSTKEEAKKHFESKFSSKTQNKWGNRNNFKPVAGKYTLLEMADEDEEEAVMVSTPKAITGGSTSYAPSKLGNETQYLMDLIFEQDMFQHAMVTLKLDTKKLPLGKLSKPQIMKGFEVLEELQSVIAGKKKGDLTELSSKFYTIIPHSFGRTVPPRISTNDTVREKMDMLIVLSDIESTQQMLKLQNSKPDKVKSNKALPPNPLDAKYDMLDSELTLVDTKSREFKVIEQFLNTTKSRNVKLIHVWKVDRKPEGERFRIHKDLANRKLLWHGTNMAVVAAILKSGLRIMPHSGGRVGKGIYFASENGKSAWYVGTNGKGLGVMFLSEVALGKEKDIYDNASSLTKAPNGYHSVVAQGKTEPDTSTYEELKFENNKVVVPVGKPKIRSISTRFSQSEYLIYKESQCRIRYLCLMQF